MSRDTLNWHAHARVLKYEPETIMRLWDRLGHEPTAEDLRRLEREEGLRPDDIVCADGNLLTTAGLNRVTSLIVGAGGQALTNSRTAVGVGNSSTAAAVSDTALGGNSAGNSWWQGPDASNPTQLNGVITTNATYAAADGNFAWNEWGLGIATAAVTPSAVFATATTSGVLLNHKVQSLGTKVNPAVWTLQSTITLS